MPLNMKNISNLTQWGKKCLSRCDVHARDHAQKVPRAVWAQYVAVQWTFSYTLRVFTKEPIRETKSFAHVRE